MRTSVELDEWLLTRARQTAAQRGITLRELFEQALCAYLEPTSRQKGYVLEFGVTHGEPLPDVPADDWSALRGHVDEIDAADYLKRFGK